MPVERDLRTGKPLLGDPGGRADKGRSARSPKQTVALVTAGVLVVAGALAAVLLTRDGATPAPAGVAASSTSAAATDPEPTPEPTPPPPVDPGPRTVPMTLTTVAITAPPGFAPDPTFGTVGEVRQRTWTLTGPCDGTGPCTVEHCAAPGQCVLPLVGTPTGTGYAATLTGPVNWSTADCVGGEITSTVTFTVSGDPLAPVIAGEWVEDSAVPVLPGLSGAQCGIYLGRYTFASA
ncbi:hypothetical protein ACI797_17385 [Geodermatophilus sp. SYSU D00691]